MPQIAGFRGALQLPDDVPPKLAGVPRDGSRAMYRYHQVFAGPGRALTRKSLVCAVQLTPYTDGMIRPHEHAAPAERDAWAARIRAAGAHVQPVVMGYRDPATEVERLCRKAEGGAPHVEVTTADGVVHRLWRIHDAEMIGGLRRYFAPRKLHVLEGHALYEAMLGYRDELAAKHAPPMYSSANYGLACLTSLDDGALATAPRHRIVRGGSAKREDVLAQLGAKFIVDKLDGAARDLGKQFAALRDALAHQPAFVLVFAGDADAWKLTLSPEVSPAAEGAPIDRALQKLDPVALQYLLVDRAFAGATVDTTTDAEAALAALGDTATAVVITRPLSIAEIAHVDELGAQLPAGSTALHPPTAPRLVGLVIDPDEDLV
jgi:hypothetical protein